MHCCCAASTETTSTVPGAVATLPSTNASENQHETLKKSEFNIFTYYTSAVANTSLIFRARYV